VAAWIPTERRLLLGQATQAQLALPPHNQQENQEQLATSAQRRVAAKQMQALRHQVLASLEAL
jgi:hypothetical protein